MDDWKKVFSNKQFTYLFASQILSQITIQQLNFLFILKIYNETGSTIATSIVWIFYALPSLIFGPFAATLVDLYDRRKLLIFTNLFQSILILLLSFFYFKSVFIIYIVIFLYSFLNQLYVPAESVTLTEVVSKKNYPTANGIFFTSAQISVIVGFLMAGIMNRFFGFSNSLYISSFLLFAAFISVFFLPSSKSRQLNVNFQKAIVDFIEKIFEGYRYVSETKSLLYASILLVILNATLTVVVVNIPALSNQILRMHADFGSIFLVVPTILGSIVSSYLIPKRLKKINRKIKIIYKSMVTISFLIAIISLIIPEIDMVNIRLLTQMLTFSLLGYSFVAVIIPLQTLIQELAPEELRGRIFGNFWFLSTLINIFPILFSGIITEVFGIRILLMIIFGIYLSIVIFIKKSDKSLYVNL